nr:hypothetical protein CFP56_23432 [Quercus suber]
MVEAKAKAFEECVLVAKDIGIHEVILVGDSLVVSNAIFGISLSPSSIASIVYGIVSLSHTFRRFEVSHVCRNGFSPVHLLAKHAQGVEYYVT